MTIASTDWTDPDVQIKRLFAAADALFRAGRPIRINCGCGGVPHPGMLNVDRRGVFADPAFDYPGFEDEVFAFPFTERPWILPDGCADFVFHEDFIEHIPQRAQMLFLAEMARMLKPGGVHRVNTPCLLDSMRRHSDPTKGGRGVHTAEWDRWEHVALLTQATLAEMASVSGYDLCVPSRRNVSLSKHFDFEFRPADDRDEVRGNVYADLVKDPTPLQRAFAEGMGALLAGDATTAEARFARVVAEDPEHPSAQRLLSGLLETRGAAEEALRAAETAMALAPGNPEFKVHHAALIRARGRTDETEALVRRIVDDFPLEAEPHHQLSLMAEARGRRGEAVAMAKQAVKLRPFDPVYAEHAAQLGIGEAS